MSDTNDYGLRRSANIDSAGQLTPRLASFVDELVAVVEAARFLPELLFEEGCPSQRCAEVGQYTGGAHKQGCPFPALVKALAPFMTDKGTP